MLGLFNKSLMLMYGGVIVYKETPQNYFYILVVLSFAYVLIEGFTKKQSKK